MAIWKKAIFWTKVKDTLAIGGLLSQGGMELGNASEKLRLWIMAGNIAGYLITMWFEDKNLDGTVDLFEKTVKTETVATSASPITIETKTVEETPKT